VQQHLLPGRALGGFLVILQLVIILLHNASACIMSIDQSWRMIRAMRRLGMPVNCSHIGVQGASA
jgi:hypothetical protein